MQASLDGDRTESTRSVNEINKLKELAESQGITTGITGTRIWMEGQVDNVKNSKNIKGDWFTITSEPYTPNKADFNAYENWDPSVWTNRNSEFKIGQKEEWKSVRFERVKTATPTQPSTSDKPIVEIEANYYTSELLKANPDKIYVFGDNNERQGKKGQASIRDEPNAMGISTKLRPSADENAFMTDAQGSANAATIDSDIAKIKATGKTVVFPKDGLGTGLAALKSKAPWTYGYLLSRLKEEFGFNNDTGTLVVSLREAFGKSTQSSTGVNPLVEAGVKPTDMYGNASKDIQMASESTQFIGFGTIMKEGNVSSTDKYSKAWGNKANTGSYTANDIIMVSGSGNFGRGGVDKKVEAEAIKKTLSEKYKPLLDKAIVAGASFRIGNQYTKGNLSDEIVGKYLKQKGYTEEKLNGYSRWTSPIKSTQPSTQVQSKQPVESSKVYPSSYFVFEIQRVH
jgi:hypothetical protein